MDYLAIAQSAVDQATAAGAKADAYISIGSQTEIQVSCGEVEKLSKAGSKGLGVRVIQNGRMGYAYTSDFSAESVTRTVNNALELAAVVDQDEYRIIPNTRLGETPDLQIYDPVLATMSTADKVAFAIAVEAAALGVDERVRACIMTAYIDGIADVYLANSNGFAGTYQSTFAAGYTMAMAFDGDDRATAMDIGVSTKAADLDAAAIGRGAGDKAVRLLGGRQVPTQRATVVYSPNAAAGLLGTLAQALTGEAMQKNRSFLHGKMGQDVAADMVTLLDNGRLPGGIATRPFDDEGIPTSATRLIDEGVLQAVLHDSYSAQREGTDSTDSSGNASRSSYRSAPALAPTNFYLQPGHLSPEELIADVEKGLYVVSTMNTHSINPVSGDYSVSAQGFWIEDGAFTHAVNEVTIALPLDQLLYNVKAVANDLMFLPFGGAIGAPTFRVDGVMIGGSGS